MNAYGHTDVAVDHNGGSDSQLEDFLEDNFNEGIMYYNYRGIYGSGGAYMPNNGNNLSNFRPISLTEAMGLTLLVNTLVN